MAPLLEVTSPSPIDLAEAALIDFRYIANALWSTDEAVQAINTG